MKSILSLAFILAGSVALAAPKISFDGLKDGQIVSSPLKVKMKVEGIKVRPAGEAIDEKTSGHHHIIVDGGPIPEGKIIPVNPTHIHFGKGQTEAEVVLTPGPHTLTLQFADGAHRSYGEKLSATMKLVVK